MTRLDHDGCINPELLPEEWIKDARRGDVLTIGSVHLNGRPIVATAANPDRVLVWTDDRKLKVILGDVTIRSPSPAVTRPFQDLSSFACEDAFREHIAEQWEDALTVVWT